MKNIQVKNLILFVSLALCWGPSFLFIKIAVDYIPPLTIALLRIAIGGIVLFVILKLKNTSLPKFGLAWKHFAVMGFFSSALPFTLFAVGEKYIDSSFASILNGTTPLFTILFAHFSTHDDRLTKSKLLGSIVGFAGLIALVFPELINGKATILGIIAGTMAAASYGVGFVYAKKNIKGFKPLVVPTAQLLLATIFLLPLSLFIDNPFSIKFISIEAMFSILGLALLGTALAFVIYYKLLSVTSATYVSAVNYILPVIGTILGIVILDENLTWNMYLGSLMILVGIMIINGILILPRKSSSKNI